MTTEPTPGEATPEAPTCYRHPGRETYVRCTRCDRYICPECMRDAAVGHQCVECVREGNKAVRENRTVFGGRVSTRPTVTITLIVINVAAFLLEAMNGSASAEDPKREYGLWAPAVADGEYYRLVTSAFLHYGMAHLVLNMWALYVVGPPLEAWLGRARFTALYALSALGGSVLVYLLSPLSAVTAGASGAVFGLFGAMFVVARRMNFDVRGIALLIGLNLVFTFTFSSISWQGHIGGLVTGVLVALAYAYAPADRRTVIQAGATVGALAVFVVAIAIRTNQLTNEFGGHIGLAGLGLG